MTDGIVGAPCHFVVELPDIEINPRMKSTSIHPLFKLDPPSMDGFHNINGHAPEPFQIKEQVSNHFNGPIYCLVNFDRSITVLLGVLNVDIVLLPIFFEIGFLEHIQYSLYFQHISFYFFQASFSGEYCFVNFVEEGGIIEEAVILLLELFIDDF